MYASTKARSREGMPGVCRGYFGTSPYRDPPSFSPTPTPIFSTPSIGEDTLLRQVCDSYASLVSNVNNQRVGTCTQEKVIETFGTSSTHPFPCFLMSLSSVFLSCPSWQYQFAWCSSFERCFLWLSVTCRRFHRTHSAFVIGPQLFPVSSSRESWQEPRVKCSVKTRYGEIENKFTSSMLLLRYGVATKASEELIMEARKQNCNSQQTKLRSISLKSEISLLWHFGTFCLDYHHFKTRIIWNQSSA